MADKEYKLDLGGMVAEYNEAITSTLTDRRDENRRERFNEWAGQSGDGKKWKKNTGANVVPFDGASDSRVPLVDSYVQEDVDMLMTSLRQMKVTALPTESGDAKKAFLASNLLRWMVDNQMDEFFHEAELAANYYCENGVAVMSVLWQREQLNGYRQIDMETIAARARKKAYGSGAALVRDVIPWYENMRDQDRMAKGTAEIARQGGDPYKVQNDEGKMDPGGYMRSMLRDGLVPALREDLVVLRAFMRVFNLLEDPRDLLADTDLLRRVMTVWMGREKREPMDLGPDRLAMVERLKKVA